MSQQHPSSEKLDRIFKSLSHKLLGDLFCENRNYELNFNNNIGNGKIKSIKLDSFTTYVEYDVTFYEDMLLGKAMIQPDSIYLFYSVKGSLLINDPEKGSKVDFQEFRTCIHATNNTSKAFLKFNKGKHYKVSFIILNRSSDTNPSSSINNQIFDFLNFTTDSKPFFHIGSFNLKVAENLDKLNKIQANSLNKKLYFRGQLNIILSIQLTQYMSDLEFNKNMMGSLTIKEIKNARALSKVIKENPELQISISEMCKRTGLSPSKLQQAFKLLHNKTANDFVRNERLKMAEKLIRKKQLNISEVAYTIGFSSRSYFSRIFKEKFGCTPKTYQDGNPYYSNKAMGEVSAISI